MTAPVNFAEGIGLAPFDINGWTAWALFDQAPNGHRRVVAFLDPEGLQRLALQATTALHLHDPRLSTQTARFVVDIVTGAGLTATDGMDERR